MARAGYLLSAVLALSLAGTSVALAGEGTPPQVDKTQGKLAMIYPAQAQKWGEEGDIIIQLQLDEKGKPTGNVHLAKSSGYDDLDTAAVQSVMRWRYIPARDAQGQPTTSWIPLRVTYKLPKAAKKTEK